jgi:hypothetical protein
MTVTEQATAVSRRGGQQHGAKSHTDETFHAFSFVPPGVEQA